MPSPNRSQSGGIAFLLAQLGHLAAERFATRVAELDLTPPQAGILRAIAAEQGRSQQALADVLGLLPSRVVAFVDDLEQRGLVERRRNADDRRLYALHLTSAGGQLMRQIGEVAKAHEEEVTAGLTRDEKAQLRRLLATMAERAGLAPGVHPGYRSIGRRAPAG